MESVDLQLENSKAPESNALPAISSVSNETLSHFKYLQPALLAVLAIAMIAQIWTSLGKLSVTSDEIDHLHAGYRYLQCNDFGWNPEHPPLVKVLAAAPLLAMKINDPIRNACGLPNDKGLDFALGHDFLFANPESMLTAARFTVSSLAMLLLVTVWFFAKELFDFPTALIAGVLLAFEPNILAHGGLVTTDVAAALGFVLAVYAAYRYTIQPNSGRLLALGLATGFALCVKYSTIVLVIVLPALLLGDVLLFTAARDRLRKLLRYSGVLLVVSVISVTMLWACYGFRYAARPFGAAVWVTPELPVVNGTIATKVIPALEDHRLLPEAYLVGLQDVLVSSELGRPTFLLGKYYHEGTWAYFPVAVTIKSTLPLLLILLASAISVRFWKARPRTLMFLLFPAILFLAASLHSKFNIGIRHLFPILPLVAIFAAAGAWRLASGRKWGIIALAALLAFHAGTSLHAFPNYLSYANELWGGPGETYRYLSDSNVDWGQAQKMARDYIEKTHPRNCFFLRTYANLNSDYDIPCGGISQIQSDTLQDPFSGTIIVSACLLDRVDLDPIDAATRRVFKDVKPTAKLGGSALLVYEGTFNVTPIVASQLVAEALIAGDQHHDPIRTLEMAQRAAQLEPGNVNAHALMCGSYHVLGRLAEAEYECNTALSLARRDREYSPEQLKHLEDFITRKGLHINDPSSRPSGGRVSK